MKIGLLSSPKLDPFWLHVLEPILKDKQMEIQFILVDAKKPKTFRQKFRKNLKRGRGGYMLVMAFKRIFGNKKEGVPIETIGEEIDAPMIRTTDPYGAETLSNVRTYNPDVMVLLGGFGIIKKGLLEIPQLGILSYHHGNVRSFRGMPPVFWEMYTGAGEVSATVQRLSTGLDTGEIFDEVKMKIRPGQGLRQTKSELFRLSAPQMHQALIKASDPNFRPEKPETYGKLYTLPNLRQWLWFHIKIGLRRCLTYLRSK